MSGQSLPNSLRSSLRKKVSKWTAMSMLCQQVLWTPLAMAAENPVVVSGAASIVQHGPNLDVTTQSDRTIIHWDKFNIPQGNTANFYQPHAQSAVLNRVTTSNNPSAIYGNLFSNGNVYLVNPAGVVVGPSGVINTNGFTASVLDLSNNDFLKGELLKFQGPGTGSILNQGTILTKSGGTTLIGSQVINEGLIESRGGNINLLTGGRVALQGGGIYTQPDQATLLNGISETAALIRNSGTLRATGVLEVGGEIYLVSPGGTVIQGAIAKATKESAGGKVVVDAGSGTANVTGTIDVSGQTGGQVAVTGKQVQLQGARINANGENGGGTIQIGGGFQGKNSELRNSERTLVDAESRLSADALISGKGGQVILWSDGETQFQGEISARGTRLGEGGFVEVSGKQTLQYEGRTWTNGGTLLLDPYNYTIEDTAAATISGELADNHVIVMTTVDQPDYGSTGYTPTGGDITVTSDILWGSANSLTLLAQGNIHLRANVQNSNSTPNGGGNLNIVAGWDGTTGITEGSPFDITPFVNSNVFESGSHPFGNNYGYVIVGGVEIERSVAVGSANGDTNLFGYILGIQGSNTVPAFAQVGFHHNTTVEDPGTTVTTGNIHIGILDYVLVNGSTQSADLGLNASYAQIGHGGARDLAHLESNWNYTGDITLQAGGNLTVSAGTGQATYGLIGNGGGWASGDQAGNHTIQIGGNLSLTAGNGVSSFAQIGNRGYLGNNSGNHLIQVDGDTLIQGGAGTFAYSQIGNGGVGAVGDQSGNLALFTTNLTMLGGTGTTAQIGNGNAAKLSGGLISGNLLVSVNGESSLVDGSGSWMIGNRTSTANGVSDSSVIFLTKTMDNASGLNPLLTQFDPDAVFLQRMVENLAGGDVTLGAINSQTGATGGMRISQEILYSSENTLNLISKTDIRFDRSVQNSSSGDLNVIAGWNGTAGLPPHLEEGLDWFDVQTFVDARLSDDGDVTTLYGQNNGSILIGSSTATASVAVGSAFGNTRGFGGDLTVRGSDAGAYYAQLGYHHTSGGEEHTDAATGDISVSMTNNITLQGGSQNFSGGNNASAQIGHGGYRNQNPITSTAHYWDYSGDISVAALGDVTLQGGGKRAFSQIGHGGFWGHGNLSGAILLTGETLTLQGGVEDSGYAQIGHGATAGVTEGNRQGDIAIRIDEETSINAETRWRIGHYAISPDTVTDANILFLTGTLDYDTANETPATQTLVNSDFANIMKANLAGGNVTIGSTNTTSGPTGGMLVTGEMLYSSIHDLNFLSTTDLRFAASVQNSQVADLIQPAGSINVIAGWSEMSGISVQDDRIVFSVQPFVESLFGDDAVHPFGKNDGSVLIGGSTATQSVAVGSANGKTRVFAHDLALRGSDSALAYAQLGYHHTTGPEVVETTVTTGDLLVGLTGSLTGRAGEHSDNLVSSYVQIGHGGNRGTLDETNDWNYTGDMALIVQEDLIFEAGDGFVAYALIGHGGGWANGNHGGDQFLSVGRDLNVQGGTGTSSFSQIGHHGYYGDLSGKVAVNVERHLSILGGSGENAHAQIGHGGAGVFGAFSGNILVSAGGDLKVAGGNANAVYAQIGHGNGNSLFTSTMSGDIFVSVRGESSLVDRLGNWMIGHRSSSADAITDANVLFLTGSLDHDLNNESAALQTGITAPFAQIMLGNLAGGDVTIGSLNELSGESGGMLVNAPMLYSSSNTLNLLSKADIRFAASVQNSKVGELCDPAGDLNVVAGWDGRTGIKFRHDRINFSTRTFERTNVLWGHSRYFGKNDGSVFIGNETLSTGVAVGSAHGQTSVFAKNLTLRGSDSHLAYAQLGYNHTTGEEPAGTTITTGKINVSLFGELDLLAGLQGGAPVVTSAVQIGHGGNRPTVSPVTPSWNYTGDLTIVARGDITLQGNTNIATYAQIGNGGDYANGDHSGEIRVTTKGNLTLNGGTGQSSFVQIGNRGRIGNTSGDLTISAGKDILLQAGSNNYSYAQIGNGGSGTFGNHSGKITITKARNLELKPGSLSAYSQIGHNSYQPYDSTVVTNTMEGDISITLSGNLLVDGGATSSLPSVIGHGMIGQPVARTNNVTGDITLTVGKGAELKHGMIGHLAGTNGEYTGNTWIAIATKDSSSKLKADEHSQFFSASYENGGELRFYLPYQKTLALHDNTLLNGTAASDLYGDNGFLYNRVGHDAPFEGDYDINSELGNYGFYINALGIVVVANSGSSTYGSTPTNPGLSLAEGSDSLQDGDTLASLGFTTNFNLTKYSDADSYDLIVDSPDDTGVYELIGTEDGVFTVNKANLVITPKSQSKTYGDALTLDQTRFTVTGLKNNDKISKVALTSDGTPATADAGKYDITATGISRSHSFKESNYNITYNTLNHGLTVNRANLVIKPKSQSKTYGDALTLDQTRFTIQGLKNDDEVSRVSLSSGGASAGADAGKYDIKATGIVESSSFKASNYKISYQTLRDGLTVNRANLVIKPKSQSKTYGDALTLDQTRFTIQGLKNDDEVSRVSLSSWGASAGADAGKYDIKATGIVESSSFKASNYNISYQTLRDGLTVGKANLVITPKSQSKTYGDALTLNQTRFTVTGLKNNDKVTEVTLTSDGTPATADAGRYDITATGIAQSESFKSKNYNITYNTLNNGLTVNRATLVIKPTSQSKTYGDALTLDQTKFTATGLKNDDEISRVSLFSLGSYAQADAGNYDIFATGIAESSSFKSSNYLILLLPLWNGLSVGKADLVITPKSQSKTYGDALTLNQTRFTVTGLKNNDKVTEVTLTSDGTPATADAGRYDITATGIAQSESFKSKNYNITYNTLNNGLTVNRATLVIKPTSQSKTYGDALTLDQTKFTATGLKNDDEISRVSLFSLGSYAQADAGNYDIFATGIAESSSFKSSNYLILLLPLWNGLSVGKADLVITPKSQSKTYGDLLTLDQTEFSITGLKNNDKVSQVTLVSDGTPATANAGQYDITATGIAKSSSFKSSNYNITYETLENGLTVNKANLTITPTSQSKTYGDSLVLDTTKFAATGLKNDDVINNVALTSDGTPATANAGLYDITATSVIDGTSFDASNYNITYETLENGLTVNKADLTITPTSQSKTYGDSLVLDTTKFTATGLKNDDVINNVALTSDGTPATANAGLYDITATSVIDGTSFDVSNYNITYETLENGLTVNKANLTITPTSQSKTYGDSLVLDTTKFEATGLKNDDVINNVALTSDGTPATANAGLYDITATSVIDGTSFDASNYNITYETLENGLTVNKADLTITPTSQSKTYGDSLVLDTTKFEATGLKNDDVINNVALTSDGTPATANAGLYDITATSVIDGTSFDASNYNITYETLTNGLTVNKASLLLMPTSQTKQFGFEFVFNGTEFVATGLKNGESVDLVTLSSEGTQMWSPLGNFDINSSKPISSSAGFHPGNYDITFGVLEGGFHVIPAEQAPSIMNLGSLAEDEFDRPETYFNSIHSLFSPTQTGSIQLTNPEPSERNELQESNDAEVTRDQAPEKESEKAGPQIFLGLTGK